MTCLIPKAEDVRDDLNSRSQLTRFLGPVEPHRHLAGECKQPSGVTCLLTLILQVATQVSPLSPFFHVLPVLYPRTLPALFSHRARNFILMPASHCPNALPSTEFCFCATCRLLYFLLCGPVRDHTHCCLHLSSLLVSRLALRLCSVTSTP